MKPASLASIGTAAIEGASRRGSALVVIHAGGARRHPLPERGTLTIGRSRRADVRIDAPSLSRVHSQLSIDRSVVVRDLGSTHGSFVGGIRLAPHTDHPLRAGDVLQLGAVTVALDLPAADSLVSSLGVRGLESTARRLAATDANITIVGETGTGKGRLARWIHAASPRRGRPLVTVACAASPADALERELAGDTSRGLAPLGQRAAGGTVLLDDVDELPRSLQPRLWDLLDRHAGRIRFLSTTRRDLGAAAAAGEFRDELRHRLAAATVVVPPLRARRAELVALAHALLRRACATGTPPRLSTDACNWLLGHPLPGNVRELDNRLTRALALIDGEWIRAADLDPDEPGAAPTSERDRIVAALEACGGNQTQAARRLGVSRRTLIDRIERMGLPRPKKGARPSRANG